MDTAPKNDAQNALSALVEYLPTETVTLYLAAVPLLPELNKIAPAFGAWGLYGTFAVLTPVLFALVYAGKRRVAKLSRWPGTREWPWWPTIAATIAFLAWGLAVPQGPFVTNDGKGMLAGLLAVFVSALLGVVGKVVSPA
jgi:hypothetical protein